MIKFVLFIAEIVMTMIVEFLQDYSNFSKEVCRKFQVDIWLLVIYTWNVDSKLYLLITRVQTLHCPNSCDDDSSNLFEVEC